MIKFSFNNGKQYSFRLEARLNPNCGFVNGRCDLSIKSNSLCYLWELLEQKFKAIESEVFDKRGCGFLYDQY